jgi:hypothetical protein
MPPAQATHPVSREHELACASVGECHPSIECAVPYDPTLMADGKGKDAVHSDPVWRERADFIIGASLARRGELSSCG